SSGAEELASGGQTASDWAPQRAQAETLVEQEASWSVGASRLAGPDKRRGSCVGPRLSDGSRVCGERKEPSRNRDRRGTNLVKGSKAAQASGPKGATISARTYSARVASLGRKIAQAYPGRRVDAVVTLQRGFMFALRT